MTHDNLSYKEVIFITLIHGFIVPVKSGWDVEREKGTEHCFYMQILVKPVPRSIITA